MDLEPNLLQLYREVNPQRSNLYESAPTLIKNNEIEKYIISSSHNVKCQREAGSLIRNHINTIVEYAILTALARRKENEPNSRIELTKEDIEESIQLITLKKTKLGYEQETSISNIPRSLILHIVDPDSLHPLLRNSN